MRSAIFTLIGAFLLATATFLYGMVFLGGAVQRHAFLVGVGGTLAGGYLGLLVAALTRPSGVRRTQLILRGAIAGLLAGLVYGVVGLGESCGSGIIDKGFCGLAFLGRLSGPPWIPIALWTLLGGVLGAVLAWIAAAGLRKKRGPLRVQAADPPRA